jgi:ribonuclease E
MTFTEAALEVLRREGKPLHFKKITEIAIRENLLDHVGKIPEEVMADQVAAHCRLPKLERRMVPVLNGTFALVEWGLDEDPQGLTALIEVPPVDELPYRSRERHPMPSRELARAPGRGERGEKGRRREEGEEKRGRRFPPPAEVAYEILAGSGGPLTLGAIAAQGAERLLMPDAFVRDAHALAAALAEDNRRRESAGRSALFLVDGDLVTLVAQPEPGERTAVVAAAPRVAGPGELRRAGLAALRRRLRECDAATIEHVVGRLVERLGFKELKVAKRGREHVILTARKRLGLIEVRHCIRVLRTGVEATRRDVVDTRRDLGHYGAQIGVVVTAGEAAREARGDATAAGQLPVLLLCGEALAEAFAEVSLGCVPVVVPEVDEAFFATATELAAAEEEARRARREERDRRDGEREERGEEREPREGRDGEGRRPRREDRPPRPPRPPRPEGEPAVGSGEAGEAPMAAAGVEGSAASEPAPLPPAAGDALEVVVDLTGEAAGDGPDDEDGPDDGTEDEGPDEEGAATVGGEATAGAEGKPAGEGGRRRRRRRRRRGGRGRREGGAQAGAPGGAPGAEGTPAGGASPGEPGGGEAPAPRPPPPPEPSGGTDGA